MGNSVDMTNPEGKWAFDADVTDVFDDMLARSIPQYEVMRQLCFDIGSAFVQSDTAIVDLGASRGNALAPYVARYGAANTYVAVEVSEPMLEALRARYGDTVDVRADDLRTDYPPVKASVTLCVLTLQFTPIEYRQRILRTIYRHTVPGGALLLVEKVLGATADLDALLVETYYAMKAANGYSQEAIDRKRLSLEGVLVPVTAEWNEDLLRQAGFTEVDCVWRWCNFAAWVAVRDSS